MSYYHNKNFTNIELSIFLRAYILNKNVSQKFVIDKNAYNILVKPK